MARVFVEQDGTDFYVRSNADRPGADAVAGGALALQVFRWHDTVLDYDLRAAQAARQWFLRDVCPRYGWQADFDADVERRTPSAPADGR